MRRKHISQAGGSAADVVNNMTWLLDTAVRAAWLGPGAFLDGAISALPERNFLAQRSGFDHRASVCCRGARWKGRSWSARTLSMILQIAAPCVGADDWPGPPGLDRRRVDGDWLEILSAEVLLNRVGAECEAVDLFWLRDLDGGSWRSSIACTAVWPAR